MARCLPVLATLAVATTALGGCDGGSSSSSPSTTTPATSASPLPSTPASPTPSRIAITGRTAADLKKVLLELRDMPRGFAVEPEKGPDNSTTSSKDPKCATLVRLMTTNGPGATAHRVFSGGRHGPIIEEALTAEDSAKALAGRTASFRAAVSTCHSVTVRIPGRGSSTVGVREIPAPQQGTGPVAFQLSATGGPLDGRVITRAC